MHQDLYDRLTRAESWIQAARDRNGHEAFVFLFMALNAMYGRRQYEGGRSEVRQDIERFLTNVWTMHKADERLGGQTLADALDECQGWSEALLVDPFVNDDYWGRRIDFRQLEEAQRLSFRKSKRSVGANDMSDSSSFS